MDAYKLVLVDTPLAAYMSMNFNGAADFTELNIEVIRNTLYKAYLEVCVCVYVMCVCVCM